MLRIIIAGIRRHYLNYLSNCSGLMSNDLQNMTRDELVDILAQKTGRFTQLLVYKDFGNEYKECKEAIQEILAEIELRKEVLNERSKSSSSSLS